MVYRVAAQGAGGPPNAALRRMAQRSRSRRICAVLGWLGVIPACFIAVAVCLYAFAGWKGLLWCVMFALVAGGHATTIWLSGSVSVWGGLMASPAERWSVHCAHHVIEIEAGAEGFFEAVRALYLAGDSTSPSSAETDSI